MPQSKTSNSIHHLFSLPSNRSFQIWREELLIPAFKQCYVHHILVGNVRRQTQVHDFSNFILTFGALSALVLQHYNYCKQFYIRLDVQWYITSICSYATDVLTGCSFILYIWNVLILSMYSQLVGYRLQYVVLQDSFYISSRIQDRWKLLNNGPISIQSTVVYGEMDMKKKGNVRSKRSDRIKNESVLNQCRLDAK